MTGTPFDDHPILRLLLIPLVGISIIKDWLKEKLKKGRRP